MTGDPQQHEMVTPLASIPGMYASVTPRLDGLPQHLVSLLYRRIMTTANRVFFFNSQYCYTWNSSGFSLARPAAKEDKGARMQDGDMVTLTLVCENATLELHHHHTNKRHTISALDCSQPLCPGFCLKTPGHQVKFF